MEIKKVILHTKDMYKDMDVNEPDYKLWNQISEDMDGEVAYVIKSSNEIGVYAFLGLFDRKKDKELFYKMEQDSLRGNYIGEREEFEKVWDSQEYAPEETTYLSEKHIETLPDAHS